MSFNNDQTDPKVPLSNAEKRETSNLLPKYYRTRDNKKFLQATLDQLVQPGTVKKISGYIGRESAKATNSSDIFLEAADGTRQDYQLEPSAIIKDYLGNTLFFKDYQDHINHIHVFGGDVSNHSRINQQEFYSWNPHIDWDKFVNFQQYYWLPFGPDSIGVAGQQQAVISEYTVELVDEGDNFAYLFTPNGLTRNPALTLFRGQTYIFNIDSPDNPFSIKTRRTTGTLDRYYNGVSDFAIEQGIVTFTVPVNAPDVLFYVSETAVDTGGIFKILDIEENTFLDIDADIIGKRNYQIPTGPTEGIKLSNGMKVYFSGKVIPEEYSQSYWYVEGVGESINLINERSLEVRSTYTEEQTVFFDDTPFDELPYSEIGTFPGRPDYITINKSSIDNNAWSRYNRWFHKDVIEVSAKANNKIAALNQSSRATRPIIEFNPNIKLYNYGIEGKKSVDVIDNFTKDVFSSVEGTLGYSIDGIDLVDGMRVLFNADTDTLVKNKIYKVNFIEVQIPGREIDFQPETTLDIENNKIIFIAPHGLIDTNQVTYLQNGNIPISGLTNRKIYYVKVIDAYSISLFEDQSLKIIVELFNISTGIHKFEIFSGLRRQIYLTEEPDTLPVKFETVAVRFGTNQQLSNKIIGNQGQNYWFNGNSWVLAQVKTTVNQQPLFDVFDNEGNSYADVEVYEGSSFSGSKLFSYTVGSGANDSVLGFPLSYKNISNVGDIVFNFDILKDIFSYKVGLTVNTKKTDVGYLKISKRLDSPKFENGWKKSKVTNIQPIVRVYKNSGLVNQFLIDVFEDKNNLADLVVKVYINGKRLNKSQYFIADAAKYKIIGLENDVAENDIVTLKCYSKQVKNNNGYYDIPINLQNNPLNDSILEFTLGQVIDHVDTIVENIGNFSGINPGLNNLRDISDLSSYGTRFVQHGSPLNFSIYHLGNKSTNLINALDKARTEYNQFKKSFIIAASSSGIDLDPKRHVDFVLQELNKDKPKTQPYYLSDMVPYTASNKIEIVVLDSRIKTYPISEPFNITVPSNRAIHVYVNEIQLVYGKDYIFGKDAFVEILKDLRENDKIEIYEYESTDGCFCPPTLTKLGIYPKFEPCKFIDNTYIDPAEVIQGHDGSITICFGDYRDDLLLELEKRIYNNIKVHYDPEIFDIYNYIPGYSRTTAYSLEEFNKIISKYFFQWTQNIPYDFIKNEDYDRLNEFTYNYSSNYTIDDKPLPGGWRGVYRWLFDTTSPHLTPWEMLGYSIKPKWWEDTYGPAPYTSDNLILWNDLKEGIVRIPNRPIKFNKKFARPVLHFFKPVDSQGNLLSPYSSGIAKGQIGYTNDDPYKFGDEAKVESAWRKSSYYPFAVIQTLLLMHPCEVFSACFDRSRIVKNLADQLIYSESGLRIRLKDIVLPSISSTSTNRTYTSGLVNYVVDYLTSEKTDSLDNYSNDLKTLTNNIATRLGGFTSKDKYRLILDSKTPSSSGGVFVPSENYYVDLNVSSAIKKIVYSGIIITKFTNGFEVRGYDVENPYFSYYAPYNDSRTIRIGGISESFLTWAPQKTYIAGKIVLVGNQYYRTLINHTSDENFNESLFVKILELPIVGGREAKLRKSWDKRQLLTVPYGAIIEDIQEVIDIIQGYGEYLTDQGFVFEEFNNNISAIANWETSVKEFLFWTTQNWGEGSVLSLSPAADKIVFNSTNSVVNNLIDSFYNYGIYRVDGQKLEPQNINVYRNGNEFILEPYNTNYGIYGATLYLVQKEHVVILDDTTLFNDTIYDKAAGYRQEKIKVLGYVTTNWNGGFEIPGFIYDRAIINDWQPWNDYNLGDIVKYKEFYYSAARFLVGTNSFNNADWVLLEEKPKSQLLPNWDYKTEQFTDFYDLDTDNFDAEQQKVAQHLTGYQKRQYLENIINNDVSQYKFYQGMIAEKGTQNSLNKLFDVLSSNDKESLTFDEEWAFRVGEYGALDTFTELEFILDQGQFKLNPQPLEIVDNIDPLLVDFVYRQRTNDIYIKPEDFTKNIWPKKKLNEYLRTPGYVRFDQVKYYTDNIEDIITKNISDLNEGDYIWTPFEDVEWNVYRFTLIDIQVVNVVKDSNPDIIILETNIPSPGITGDLVGIKNSVIEGIYIVESVEGTFIKLIAPKVILDDEYADRDTLDFYIFKSARISNIDLANSTIPKYLKDGETLWVDNNGKDLWTVYKNDLTTNFTKEIVLNTNPSENLNFGKSVAIDGTGTKAAVATNKGLFIYSRTFNKNNWTPLQYIEKSEIESISDFESPNFGTSLAFSKDNKFLIVTDSSATKDYSGEGAVAIFVRLDNEKYTLFGNIIFGSNTNKGLGKKVDITNKNGTYQLAVTTEDKKVKIYQYSTGNWRELQTLTSPTELPSSFAFDVSLGSDNFKLVISDPGINKVLIYNFNFSTSLYSLTQEIESTRPFINLVSDWDIDGFALINNHGYDEDINGSPFIYNRLGSTDASGIERGKVYFIRLVDQNRLSLYTSKQNALDDVDRIKVNSAGVFRGERGIETLISAELDFNVSFGNSVDISETENYLAIGSSLEDKSFNEQDSGKLYIYKYNGTSYERQQVLENNFGDSTEQFATKVEFMNDDETIAVFSLFTKTTNGIEFVDDSIFDIDTTRFFDTIKFDVGRIDIYDRYNSNFIYGKTLETNNTENTEYGKNIAVGSNAIIVSASRGDQSLNVVTTAEIVTGNTYKIISLGTLTQQQWNFICGTSNVVYKSGDKFLAVNYGIDVRQGRVVQLVNFAGQVYSYVKPGGIKSWKADSVQSYKIDVNLIKKVFLYNKVDNKIITYLDVVDPTQGKIPGPADQEIKYKTYFDPAIYSFGTEDINVDAGMAWQERHIGMLWWDLSTARFLDNESGDVVYRTSTWNRLYDTASVDVYEWVESSIPPERWDELLETEEGNALGISGNTKYGSTVYSIKRKYDNVSQSFSDTYYFWVINKVTIPNIEGRTLSSRAVASLIEDPRSNNYSCIILTDSNTISLVNVEQYLNDKNVVLSLQYWNNDSRETNYHSQWKLLSTNKNTTIPSIIEEKWLHSLVGKDNTGRIVPDPKLPTKQRYGIEYRPRQGMFSNRIEALKQYVERVNNVLKDVLLVDIYDISKLTQSDTIPNEIRSEWDVRIDSSLELRFISTRETKTAELIPIINDGKIISATVVTAGKGYGKFKSYEEDDLGNVVSWSGPSVQILGNGVDAKLRTIINNLGEVIGVEVLESGEGYLDDTSLLVRPFTVLVDVDNETLGWALYSYDRRRDQWNRTKVQAYDVNKYWTYIDWYADGYNQFVKVDKLLNNTYELVTQEVQVGSVVKIRNVGSGGWMLLEKFNNLRTIDYTLNFKVVGRERGTIQFLNTIYSPNKGFDRFLLDSVNFDIYPVEELRIIFDVVKNNLLVDDLKVEYLKLFFASVRYALHEQAYVDWAFKTSFVKSQHNLGELKQKVTYNSDNLDSFEQYINEVKPYHTKVREYVSSYTAVEPSRSAVTDFDLLPVIDETFKVSPLKVYLDEQGEIVTDFTEIIEYPWAFWTDNLGFEIVSIEIVDQGDGYTSPPIIEISGNQLLGGTPSTAKAYITKGRVNRIDLLNSGSKWIKAPTVSIKGSLKENGRPARAVAIIGNSPIRSNYVKVKFDRVSKTYQVTALQETEIFSGSFVSGSRSQFPLKWSPNINFDKYSVSVNGAEALKSEYTLSTVTKFVNGGTRFSGILKFTIAPPNNAVIKVEYLKNFDHLSATDRINFFYNPTTGQIGKDLSQLMTGVDYGGVSVTGLGFENKYGWDTQPWFIDVWDGVAEDFEDSIFDVNLAPKTLELEATLVVNQNTVVLTKGTTENIQPGMIVKLVEGLGTFGISAKVLSVTNSSSFTVTIPHRTSGFVKFVISNINYTYRLPYVPAEGEVITVYLSKFNNDPTSVTYRSYFEPVRIDDINYLTINQTNENALMTSFIGDDESDIIVLPTLADLRIYNDVFEQGFDGGRELTINPSQFIDGGSAGSATLFVVDGNLINTDPLTYSDRIIFRKITSDGSIKPREDDYDTELTGGDLSYFTATGFNPDDIILDGDGLVTSMTSHAPEEIVPGQIIDTLAIKVYTRPSGGAPNIMFKTYYGDGTTFLFDIGQYFLNSSSVIVKVNNEIKEYGTEYSFNYTSKNLHFGTAPSIGDVITIVSISFNSASMLDLDYFVVEGEVREFVTRAPWLPTINATVLVDGDVLSPNFYQLFSTDDRYSNSLNESWRARVGIRFLNPIADGSLINYIIDQNGLEQSASVVKSETIIYQDGQSKYDLLNEIGINLPHEPNILIKLDNKILRAPSYSYFTLNNNQLVYELSDSKYQHLNLTPTDINVYLNGKKLNVSKDYLIIYKDPNPYYVIDTENFKVTLGTLPYQEDDQLSLIGNPATDIPAIFKIISGNVELISPGVFTKIPANLFLTGGSGSGARVSNDFVTVQDLSKFSVSLKKKKYVDQGLLVIEVMSGADYKLISPTKVEFIKDLTQDDRVEILSFYNHNILGIERTVDTFNQTTNLDPSSLEYREYLGKLGGTFKLRSTVPSGDFVWVIKNGELLSNNINYYLETDLRTVKLVDYPVGTDIIEILAFTNTVITDEFGYMQFKDALNRTHYKRLNKDKSTILVQSLKQLDKSIFVEDPTVLDLPNPLENRPGIIEINGERIEYFIRDGNELRQLRRATLGTSIPDEHAAGSIIQGLGASETIPYKDEFKVIEGTSTQFPNLYINGTMQLNFRPTKDDVEVFVGGYRLKKNSYVLYTQTNGYPYSPISPILDIDPIGTTREGDTKLESEFTISGTGLLKLSKLPIDVASGTKLRVVVVRKQGKIWNDIGKRLANSTNSVAEFITAVKTNWPE